MSNQYIHTFIYSIPREDPSGFSLILGTNDFSRIKKAARVPTAEELAAAEEHFKNAKAEATVSQSSTAT